MHEEKIYIGEVAERLNRKPHTVRVWIYQKKLPKALLPKRDKRNWRYWTEDQVAGLEAWLIEEDIRPGKGLETTHR